MGIQFNHPAPGQFIRLQGKTYEIIRHTVEWDESGITAETGLLEVDDNAEPIILNEAMVGRNVNLDMWDYTIL